MSIKIRLRRMGAKKRPFYRLVVADSRSPRDGRFIETLGHYHPLTDPATITFDEEKIAAWLKRGAIPTETVRSLLKKIGFFQRRESNGKTIDVAGAEVVIEAVEHEEEATSTSTAVEGVVKPKTRRRAPTKSADTEATLPKEPITEDTGETSGDETTIEMEG